MPKILLGILTLLIRKNKVQLDFNCIAMLCSESICHLQCYPMLNSLNENRICPHFIPTQPMLCRKASQIRTREFEKSVVRARVEHNEQQNLPRFLLSYYLSNVVVLEKWPMMEEIVSEQEQY